MINKLFRGDKRTVKASKNIVLSFGIKGIDSIVQLLLVPVTLGYLNSYEYGIWLTLNSILLWIDSFDIGLGNGLRNKLGEAIALNDLKRAKAVVSTAYVMIILLTALFLIVGSVLILNINWYALLGVNTSLVLRLKEIVYVSFLLFCINFALKFISNIYLAKQMPSISNLFATLSHVLALIIIIVLKAISVGNLFYVAVAFSISPIFVYMVVYPITFKYVYEELSPSVSLFNKTLLKDIFNLGIFYFLLQISGVVLFASTNVIISNFFGPENVTPYNISFRYFSLLSLFLSVMLSPIWSAVTDAYTRKDFSWIKKTLKKTEQLFIILIVMGFVMFVLSKIIYSLWIGNDVKIGWYMSLVVYIYTVVISISTGYSFFLNGMGKLRLQMITTITIAVMYIPLCWVFSKIFGVEGIVLALIVLNLPGLCLNRVQVRKLINGKAFGLWNE